MPNYKSMYFTLFNSLTDAIDILKKAQQETELLYLSDNFSGNQVIEISCRNEDK